MKTFISWLNWLTSQREKKTTPTQTTKTMKDICQILSEIQPDHKRGLVFMPYRGNEYWMGLPAYANIYIRKPYEMITDNNGLLEFCQYFLLEYSISNNEEKKLAIKAVVFPLYHALTGVNYDTDQFKAYGLTTQI